MTNSVMHGRFTLNGRVIPNQLTQRAFDLIGALLSRSDSDAGFSFIQIADAAGDEIAAAATIFTFAALPSEIGCQITGQATFESTAVTSDVHFLRLLDGVSEVLAEAELPTPLPSGTGFIIGRSDILRPA